MATGRTHYTRLPRVSRWYTFLDNSGAGEIPLVATANTQMENRNFPSTIIRGEDVFRSGDAQQDQPPLPSRYRRNLRRLSEHPQTSMEYVHLVSPNEDSSMAEDRKKINKLLHDLIPVRPIYEKTMCSYDTRLVSFEEAFIDEIIFWPDDFRQALARSGFYAVRISGEIMTCCFACGLGLKFWQKDAVPAIEHARHAPTCHFLRLSKSQEFIDRHTITQMVQRPKVRSVLRFIVFYFLINFCGLCYRRCCHHHAPGLM